MNPQGLQDIHSFDVNQVSWWPLAPGWWLLLILMIGLLILGIWGWHRWYQYQQIRKSQPPRWQSLAWKEWRAIQMADLSAKERLQQLARLLRWVAIQQYGREDCASLTGDDWLQWLTDHDPQKFNWLKQGNLLVTGLYAPPSHGIDEKLLNSLETAIYAWIVRDI